MTAQSYGHKETPHQNARAQPEAKQRAARHKRSHPSQQNSKPKQNHTSHENAKPRYRTGQNVHVGVNVSYLTTPEFDNTLAHAILCLMLDNPRTCDVPARVVCTPHAHSVVKILLSPAQLELPSTAADDETMRTDAISVPPATASLS